MCTSRSVPARLPPGCACSNSCARAASPPRGTSAGTKAWPTDGVSRPCCGRSTGCSSTSARPGSTPAASTLAQAVPRWRRLAPRTVVKHGSRGAFAIVGGGVLRVAAPEVRVVDTTGAGDAFNGGFLAALVRGRDVKDCLRLGVHVGSLSTRAAGGIDGVPSRAEIDEVLGPGVLRLGAWGLARGKGWSWVLKGRSLMTQPPV